MSTVYDQQEAGSSSVIYSPLDYIRPQVRFLEIIPSGADDQQVSCRLEAMELLEDTRYAALSYVWGDPNITECILVNGIEMPVTTNLASALRHFRNCGFPHDQEIQRLWVDAICINQKDVTEKNNQVPLMGKLYKNASSVLSWLGAPDANNIDNALGIIHRLAPVIGAIPGRPNMKANAEMVHAGFKWLNSTLGPSITSKRWAPLAALSESTYWTRIWIFQEIVLARSPWSHWFICGNAYATFAEISVFDSFLRSIRKTPFPSLDGYGPNSRERASWLSLSQGSEYQIPGMPTIEALKQDDRYSVFIIACVVSQKCSATLPHDFLYAVMGIVPHHDIKPDYSKSVKEVYRDAVRFIGQGFNLLVELSGRGFNTENEYGLPSWLPDLSKLRVLNGTFYDARVKKRPQLIVKTVAQAHVDAGNILCIRGVICASVEHLMHINFEINPKDHPDPQTILYNLCLDYLVKFFGDFETICTMLELDVSWGSDRMAAKLAGKRPLEALLDVLDWKKKDTRTKRPEFFGCSGLNLSPIAWFFYIMLRTSTTLSQDEKDVARAKLNLPLNIDLSEFMTLCFADYNRVSSNHKEFENLPIDESIADFPGLARNARNLTLFKTNTGHLGIGPPDTKLGDFVCAIGSSTLPALLRKDTGSDRERSYFEHEGCCYVLGLSDGEPANMVADGELEIQTFHIR
ncbi:heterokaryon incompatibility protein-domain-containing protein [Xylaria cubensis]|nr:heterokaryon incompatibility protein-domain-containing protein [Xylaria cubensis]